MYKFLPFIFLIFISCQKQIKKVDFKGVWIDKEVLARKGTNKNIKADGSAPFPLILIDKVPADSMLFYYDRTLKIVYPSHTSYNSMYCYINKNEELFLLPDYDTGELVFSNLNDDKFRRFVKVKGALSKEDVLNPDFDIDTFIQTVM